MKTTSLQIYYMKMEKSNLFLKKSLIVIGH
jgi:hypothetical protein